MRKDKFDNSKTHANVGRVGKKQRGKTTLTDAIAKVLEESFKNKGENKK